MRGRGSVYRQKDAFKKARRIRRNLRKFLDFTQIYVIIIISIQSVERVARLCLNTSREEKYHGDKKVRLPEMRERGNG